MPSLARDIRYGTRSLLKHPGLVVVAVLALTLGIGLTTTMFSIVYSVMMRGLPFRDGGRIVTVWENNLSRGWRRVDVPIEDYRALSAQQHSFAQLAAFYSGTVNVSGTEKPERYLGSWVTANTFDIAGVRPLLGRTLRRGEDEPGGDQVVVLSYAMWHDRYGADPAIVGKTIRANGSPCTVVGVMPEGYAFPDDGRLWLPLQLAPDPGKRAQGERLQLVGLLKPGVTMDVANTDVGTVARRLATEHKETKSNGSRA